MELGGLLDACIYHQSFMDKPMIKKDMDGSGRPSPRAEDSAPELGPDMPHDPVFPICVMSHHHIRPDFKPGKALVHKPFYKGDVLNILFGFKFSLFGFITRIHKSGAMFNQGGHGSNITPKAGLPAPEPQAEGPK